MKDYSNEPMPDFWQRHQSAMIWLCSLAGIIAVAGFLSWTNGRDAQIQQGATAYEQCVNTKYQMTPMAYYEQNGEMPYCAFEVDGATYEKVPGGWKLKE